MPTPKQRSERAPPRYRQIKINVIGRKSGKTTSIPLWFVLEGERLSPPPVHGSDTQWFVNLAPESVESD